MEKVLRCVSLPRRPCKLIMRNNIWQRPYYLVPISYIIFLCFASCNDMLISVVVGFFSI